MGLKSDSHVLNTCLSRCSLTTFSEALCPGSPTHSVNLREGPSERRVFYDAFSIAVFVGWSMFSGRADLASVP